MGKTSDQKASKWNLTGTKRGNTSDDRETQSKVKRHQNTHCLVPTGTRETSGKAGQGGWERCWDVGHRELCDRLCGKEEITAFGGQARKFGL